MHISFFKMMLIILRQTTKHGRRWSTPLINWLTYKQIICIKGISKFVVFSPDRRNQADATKLLRHNLLSIYYRIKKGSQLASKRNIHFDHKRVVVIYIYILKHSEPT